MPSALTFLAGVFAVLGATAMAHAEPDYCGRACGVWARRCSRDLIRSARRLERLCGPSFGPGGQCRGAQSPTGECDGYASAPDCRREARDFMRGERSKCDAGKLQCQTCCAGGGAGATCARSPACAEGSAQPTLRVNGRDGSLRPGDGELSLGDALALAAGALPLGGLDAEERAQVTGSPGATSADVITFALPRGLVVRASGAAGAGISVYPALTGGGDTVDGCGVVHLDGSALGRESQLSGLALSSDGNVVRGLVFTGFPNAGVFVHAAAGRRVHGNRIHGCLFRGAATTAGVTVTGGLPGLGAGAVTGTAIEDNVFRRNLLALNIIGALAVPGLPASGGSVEDTAIAGNLVEDQQEGIQVYGGLATAGATARGGRVRDVVARDNRMRRIRGGSIVLAAGSPSGAGATVTDSSVAGTFIAGNDVADGTGVAIFATGALAFGGGIAERNTLSDLTATDNVTAGHPSASVSVFGGYAERGERGRVGENRVTQVVLVGHRSTRDLVGLSIAGGTAFATGVPVVENVVDGVEVRDSRFTADGSGVDVQGAVATELECLAPGTFSPDAPGAGLAAEVADNVARNVRLRATEIVAPATGGVSVAGAYACRSTDLVRDNAAAQVAIEGITITDAGAAGVSALGARAIGKGSTTGSRVDGLAITGSRIERAVSAGIAVVGAGTQEGGTSTGAGVRGIVIRDTAVVGTRMLLGAAGGDGIVLRGDSTNVVDGALLEANSFAQNAGQDVVVDGATGVVVTP